MIRVGFGFDAHRFSDDSKLIIGGVEIPSELGLKGHSDADVLSHAICDAILGAQGEGDIGTHFPDSDPKYKGVSSLMFIKEAIAMLRKKKLNVQNIDCVIVCEKPRIAPYIEDIKNKLGAIDGLSSAGLSIKATTTDKMGFTGRGEGIASYAVVLVSSAS